MEIKVGTFLKQDTSSGVIFYRISSVHPSSFGVKSFCRIREGYLTIKYEDKEHHIYKSEAVANYLIATKKELNRIREILDEFSEFLFQN